MKILLRRDKGKDFMACSMVSTVPSASPGANDLDGILIQLIHWEEPESNMEKRENRKQ